VQPNEDHSLTCSSWKQISCENKVLATNPKKIKAPLEQIIQCCSGEYIDQVTKSGYLAQLMMAED
jgi:hypothetical protein